MSILHKNRQCTVHIFSTESYLQAPGIYARIVVVIKPSPAGEGGPLAVDEELLKTIEHLIRNTQLVRMPPYPNVEASISNSEFRIS